MGNLPMIYPPLEIQEEFERNAAALNLQKSKLYDQNKKLSRARDLLLPRLMDGRISVDV